ncbi:MAG: D-alanyl-D-alanine carboxypeptidase/D-alanyl-D-alanine-endopeptidase [Pyrinomonadaceae bacterium]
MNRTSRRIEEKRRWTAAVLVGLLIFAGLITGSQVQRVSAAKSGLPLGTPRLLGTPIRADLPPPTPVPMTTATATPAPVSTPMLADLQTAIRQRLFDPAARHGRVGVKVISLSTGKAVLDQDADKYFIPASNMKNFTVAAAMEKLGPNFKFVTSIYAAAPPDSSGTVKGDLRVYGRGDVSISPPFATADPNSVDVYYERMDALASAIAAAGVKRIEGNIIGDESYFSGHAVPYTWEWDDMQSYDGAEVSALPLNLNAVTLIIRGGKPGQPCSVELGPPTLVYQVTNTCVTAAAGAHRGVGLDKALERNSVVVSGSIAAGERWATSISVTHPAENFVAMVKDRLQKKGVVVTGGSRVMIPGTRPVEQTVIAHFDSPPFSEIAAKTMKPSQNMFAETILWTLGEEIGRKNGGTGDSSKLGLDVVKSFLQQQVGITAEAFDPYDGSGMSRHDLITPDSIVRLYTYMAKQSPNAAVWRNALAVGGVDGTLRNRFKGTKVADNFHGKTGTLDQVSALSGYVTTASGEQLVVSIIVNNVPNIADRLRIIDGIVVQLANYTGRVDP